MNFLAHAYLSFNEPQILVGNMISDFVKGKEQFGYAAIVQKGIQLHRAIDTFTDNHPATAEAKEWFRPDYRLYSGALVDVVYDYFVANDVDNFASGNLQPFASSVYATLEKNTTQLPPNFLNLLLYMKTDNWLYNYRTEEGIQKSLRGLVRRATFINDSQTAFLIFKKRKDELQACYNAFFPDVKQMAKAKLLELLA